MTFGGQGTDWFATLRELVERGPATPTRIAQLVEESGHRLVGPSPASSPPRCRAPSSRRPGWLAARSPAAPTSTTASWACPACCSPSSPPSTCSRAEGLDLTRVAPIAAVGHSQGILGVAAFAGRREAAAGTAGATDVDLVAIARLIGAAATIVGRRAGLVPHGEDSPMLAVSGADLGRDRGARRRGLGRRRRRRRGRGQRPPPRRRERYARPRSAASARRSRSAAPPRPRSIDAKVRGGRAFAPTVESVPVALGFHHPALAPAVAMVRDWAEACGLDAGLAEHLAHAICVETVDWPRAARPTPSARPPAGSSTSARPTLSANMTGRALRGRGVTVIPAATEKGRDALFTAGAEVRTAADWSAYAPAPDRPRRRQARRGHRGSPA